MSKETPSHVIYDFNHGAAEWKRPRGHPRARWSDGLHHFLSKARMRTEDEPAVSQERVYWRRIFFFAVGQLSNVTT